MPDLAFQTAKSLGCVLLSEATFEELQRVLTCPKFDKYVSLATRIAFIAKLPEESELVIECQSWYHGNPKVQEYD